MQVRAVMGFRALAPPGLVGRLIGLDMNLKLNCTLFNCYSHSYKLPVLLLYQLVNINLNKSVISSWYFFAPTSHPVTLHRSQIGETTGVAFKYI